MMLASLPHKTIFLPFSFFLSSFLLRLITYPCTLPLCTVSCQFHKPNEDNNRKHGVCGSQRLFQNYPFTFQANVKRNLLYRNNSCRQSLETKGCVLMCDGDACKFDSCKQYHCFNLKSDNTTFIKYCFF